MDIPSPETVAGLQELFLLQHSAGVGTAEAASNPGNGSDGDWLEVEATHNGATDSRLFWLLWAKEIYLNRISKEGSVTANNPTVLALNGLIGQRRVEIGVDPSPPDSYIEDGR